MLIRLGRGPGRFRAHPRPQEPRGPSGTRSRNWRSAAGSPPRPNTSAAIAASGVGTDRNKERVSPNGSLGSELGSRSQEAEQQGGNDEAPQGIPAGVGARPSARPRDPGCPLDGSDRPPDRLRGARASNSAVRDPSDGRNWQTIVAEDGFGWAEAGVGAGLALGAAALVGGSALALRRGAPGRCPRCDEHSSRPRALDVGTSFGSG